MTTEIEQEFFKVFGIATQHLLNVNTNQFMDVYPEITDRKLLEMICILQRFRDITFNNLYFENIEHLKNEVLNDRD